MAYADTTTGLARSRSFFSGLLTELGSFFTILGAASRVASAIENHRRPDARDLDVLGIKDQFPAIQ